MSSKSPFSNIPESILKVTTFIFLKENVSDSMYDPSTGLVLPRQEEESFTGYMKLNSVSKGSNVNDVMPLNRAVRVKVYCVEPQLLHPNITIGTKLKFTVENSGFKEEGTLEVTEYLPTNLPVLRRVLGDGFLGDAILNYRGV